MTAPQVKTVGPLPDSFGRTTLRYISNKWFLVAAGGLALVGVAAFSWNWLVAAGIASILLSALPCLVMCGFGLCMFKFAALSSSTQVSAPSAADAPKNITQAAGNGLATSYAASCCGGGVLATPQNTPANGDTEGKENTHA